VIVLVARAKVWQTCRY